ncbi:MAG: FecR domain-containing protein [Bacteroidota bacterium]|nr:FecR domain-containing protein [Bacteroidota bacterium]
MENQSDINILIIRLLSGEADVDEKKIIAAWLSHSDENKKLFADLREIWLSSGIPGNADSYHLEEAILKFREKISKSKQQQKLRINFMPYLKYAAIAILILALPFSYYMGTRNIPADNSMTTITCAFGDKSSIVLPDSSRVWLNSGSKLTFNSDFKNGRKVLLEGEAFFSVSKDKNNSFRVKTTDIEIEVLGTEFNVKAYAEENTVSTTLVEGSVKISSKNQQTLLKPDQKLVFDRGNKKMRIQELTDPAPDTEWKDGRFVFRNESLAELAPKLERWFDVDIVFADEQVKNRRFTGVLQRESILEAISYFDHSQFVICRVQDNKIIIKSQNN